MSESLTPKAFLPKGPTEAGIPAEPKPAPTQGAQLEVQSRDAATTPSGGAEPDSSDPAKSDSSSPAGLEAEWTRPTQTALRAHLPALLGALVVVGLALLFQVTPDGTGITVLGARLPESCLLKSTTGHGCPGCGLTRSFATGVRLDPQAFRFHPLGPFLLLFVVAQLPYRAYRIWQGESVDFAAKPSPWPLYTLGLLALALVAVWGVRFSGALPQ